MKNISCREQGEAVFTEFESCCGDLEPYLPPGASGQPTCQPEKGVLEKIPSALEFLVRMAADILFG